MFVSMIGNIIGDVAGGILGTKQQVKGAKAASATLSEAADKGISVVNDATDRGLGFQQPYRDAGSAAIQRQLALLGLGGAGDQQTAIEGILASPDYTTAVRQGEEAILANASATGGLRGGNVRGSLANFRADQVGNAFQRHFASLAGLTQVGQNAANVSTAATTDAGGAVASLYGAQGNAKAGAQLAAGNSVINTINQMAKVAAAAASFSTPNTAAAPGVRGF